MVDALVIICVGTVVVFLVVLLAELRLGFQEIVVSDPGRQTFVLQLSRCHH